MKRKKINILHFSLIIKIGIIDKKAFKCILKYFYFGYKKIKGFFKHGKFVSPFNVHSKKE